MNIILKIILFVIASIIISYGLIKAIDKEFEYQDKFLNSHLTLEQRQEILNRNK